MVFARIEVIAKEGEASVSQGNVLEGFVAEWLRRQNYEVIKNVRLTACEIDLHCRHNVSKRTLYVECKAYNESNVQASVLKQLYGTVLFDHYDEGWLVSTGKLGKDAKGFVEEWENGRREDQKRLSFFTSERLIESLVGTGMICTVPDSAARALLVDGEQLGEWTLVLSPFGSYWASTIVRYGQTQCWFACTVNEGRPIREKAFYSQFMAYDFSLRDYSDIVSYRNRDVSVSDESPSVVEVEVGDNWMDYRPSRPEHFVGRKRLQKEIHTLLKDVRLGRTSTRVFAVTGDSGIGKSSFIAKLRHSINSKATHGYCYAVDMRAAANAAYIEQALLNLLHKAQANGFGADGEISVTNASAPLDSPTVKRFLDACEKRGEVLLLVFDQFEELYSKAEFESVFMAANRLMTAVVSLNTALVLGFAWKSDCAIPQDHQAYYLWHKQADHRHEIVLHQFSKDDARASILHFEEGIGQKLRQNLRNYLVDNGQGFPWLLKKLCLHVRHQLELGVSQADIEERALDVKTLFDQDLNSLSEDEKQCIKAVSANSPAIWFDLVKTFDPELIENLVTRRLLLKKGSRLSLYWDIFTDYINSGKLPVIPFEYIPQSTSLRRLLDVASRLKDSDGVSADELARSLLLSPKTVLNVLADLIRFGLVRNSSGVYILEQGVLVPSNKAVLENIQKVFRRHRLVEIIRHEFSGSTFGIQDVLRILQRILPPDEYDDKTIMSYSRRLCNWLIALGLIATVGDAYSYNDCGEVNINAVMGRRHKGPQVFTGGSSPVQVVTACKRISGQKEFSGSELRSDHLRNAFSILIGFGMIRSVGGGRYVPAVSLNSEDSIIERVFVSSERQESILLVCDVLNEHPQASAEEVAKIVAARIGRKWKPASLRRIGNALKIWARWVLNSRSAGRILPPPGRTHDNDGFEQMELF